MYFDILKRDLKRKKTMNIILLLFTILTAMFVASGISNVIKVINGTDYFLDKAGVGDYIVIVQKDFESVEAILDKSENVTGYKEEYCFFGEKDNLRVNGKEVQARNSATILQSIDNVGINYYLKDNSELEVVDKGEIYVTAGFLKTNDAKVGDELKISMGQTSQTFKIAGEIKDALLGSEMMGNTRLIINDEDYNIFQQDESINSMYKGSIFYIDSENVKELSSELSKASNVIFSGMRSIIKLCYVMEMIVAMIVLVLSICLIIVSFVILKFIITFSINEEFREVGVMKAIGIKNRKIRGLYVIKYFAIAVVGGVVGLIFSIPFGSMLIKSVSGKMLLGNDSGYLVNVIGAIAVVFVMVSGAYLCTGKVKKSTPVDAIRNGQTGERYKKKSLYHLNKAHTSTPMYMAVNDVVSSPKRFFIIIMSFFLCSVFVLGVVLCTDTMKSKNLITTFGKEADIYITDSKLVKMEFMSVEGNESLPAKYDEIEKDIKELGIPGKVSMEVWYKYTLIFEGKPYSVTFQKNSKTSAQDYEYTQGSAPSNPGEIAITPAISEMTGAKIGDKLEIDFGSEKKECIVVAYFQTMNQLGQVIRLHEDAPTSMEYSSAMMAFQIDFDDNPDEKEIDRRIEMLKDYYDIEDVLDAAGYCVDCIGVVGTMDSVSKLLLLITGIVVILVSVLMERTFISDETGQIALLKGIGFSQRTIIKWHLYRFMIVAVISELFAVILTIPITKLWCDPIWKMMGATNVKYYFNPWTLIVIYPGIILLVTLITVLLTSLYTRKISSRDITNIE